MHIIINMVLFAVIGGVLGHLKIHYDSVWFWVVLLSAVGIQVSSFIQGYNIGRK